MAIGKFIVLEGSEGAGKSTQVRQLCEYLSLSGQTVWATREPGGTELAEAIRDIVIAPRAEVVDPRTELLLMIAARIQHWQQAILPRLQAGEWVVCDRFIDSTLAYQGAGRGLGLQLIHDLHKQLAPEMIADLVIVLDISFADAKPRLAARGAALDRFEQADVEFFERVRAQYLQAARQFPSQYVVIDGAQNAAAVLNAIKVSVSKLTSVADILKGS